MGAEADSPCCFLADTVCDDIFVRIRSVETLRHFGCGEPHYEGGDLDVCLSDIRSRSLDVQMDSQMSATVRSLEFQHGVPAGWDFFFSTLSGNRR